jgi:hypothetical protein
LLSAPGQSAVLPSKDAQDASKACHADIDKLAAAAWLWSNSRLVTDCNGSPDG